MDGAKLGRSDDRDGIILTPSPLHSQTLPASQRSNSSEYFIREILSEFQLKNNFLKKVFSENRSIERIDLYVKSLASALKAVILQPSAKSGIHSKFSELVASNTHILARWMLHVLQPTNLLKPEVELVVNALKVWEIQWGESKLEVVGKLTGPEFNAMFLATRTVLDSISTVQSLIKVLIK